MGRGMDNSTRSSKITQNFGLADSSQFPSVLWRACTSLDVRNKRGEEGRSLSLGRCQFIFSCRQPVQARPSISSGAAGLSLVLASLKRYMYLGNRPIMLKICTSEDEAVHFLRKYGFCLLKSSWGDWPQRNEDLLAERRFALSERTKAAMTPVRSFSPSSAPEEGFSSSSEHKDVYHYTAFGRSKKEAWLPWGFGPILHGWKCFGARLFKAINNRILGHSDPWPFRYQRNVGDESDGSEVSNRKYLFRTNEDYEKYLNAVRSSKHHVLSCFRYHASNPSEFHVAAHVDKGVLTICKNPNSLEICYKGCWYALGPQPKGVVAVLAGYSLERATGGLFQAALHRVRNEGARSSRVTKIRFDPDLVLYPRAIIASADAELCDMLPDPPDYLSVRDMMVAFNSTHTSVNAAPSAVSRGVRLKATSKGNAESLHSLGLFSCLPKDLLYNFFRDWICDLKGVFLLSATCKSFRALLGGEEYLVPLADRNTRFSWDWALDKMGERLVMPQGDTPTKWLALLSKELKKSHLDVSVGVDDANRDPRISRLQLIYTQVYI